MYGFVPYNISPIQQGIQYGHAVVEYSNKYSQDTDYITWASVDKTFIILNGGTTNLNVEKLGTLNTHSLTLLEKGIKHACFYEPDLGDQLTAVVFLVDDRVWDKETWPDYAGPWISNFTSTVPDSQSYEAWKSSFQADTPEEVEKIVWLRDFLRNFRLA